MMSGWFSPSAMAKEAEATRVRRERHDQGRCAQDRHRCSYCRREEEEARAGDPAFEAALNAYFDELGG